MFSNSPATNHLHTGAIFPVHWKMAVSGERTVSLQSVSLHQCLLWWDSKRHTWKQANQECSLWSPGISDFCKARHPTEESPSYPKLYTLLRLFVTRNRKLTQSSSSKKKEKKERKRKARRNFLQISVDMIGSWIWRLPSAMYMPVLLLHSYTGPQQCWAIDLWTSDLRGRTTTSSNSSGKGKVRVLISSS